MPYGWTGNVLRIDLTEKKFVIEDVMPFTDSFIAGRGINVKTIYDHIGNDVSPFDPENRICIAPGVLAGTPAPCSSRSTITAMSPRGLLDSSGVGGFIGAEIKYAGFDQIIVEGKSDQPVYLFVTNNSVEIKDAKQLWGKDPWQTQQIIRKELGDRNIQSLSIGQAGENLVHFAGVMTGRLQSAAGRCGMGAIMGSKNLKAIAVRGNGSVRVADPDGFLDACLEAHRFIRESGLYAKKRDSLTDKVAYSAYMRKGKFMAGNFEDIKWTAEGFDTLLEDPEQFWDKEAQHLQPGGARQSGCFGCPMYHETNFYIPGQDDIARVKCLQWHSIGEVVWLKDRREVIEAAYLCDKHGLDVISTGNCISFLMELFHRGIISEKDTDGIPMKRGDIAAVKYAIEKIACQEGFGVHFRKGVAAAAQQIGRDSEQYAMHIKGIELYHQEIRSFKSKALLASIGKMEQLSLIEDTWPDNPEEMEQLAQETLGKSAAAVPNQYGGKALLVADSEERHCIGDLLGVCKFLVPWGSTQSFESIAELLSLATGVSYTEEDLFAAARRVLILERTFNAIRGIRRKDERPPQRFFTETVADGKFKGEILHADRFDEMLSEYYRIRGCNHDGIPEFETLKARGLDHELRQFKIEMSK